MAILFDDPLFERFGSRSLMHAYYGGADFGECFVAAKQIVSGDAASWHRSWTAAADRVFELGQQSAAGGHAVSAREAYLRASNYYRTSYAPLFRAPVDPRLVASFDRESAAFRKAAALMTPAAEPVEIPFEGTTLPGYFYRADESSRPRPLLIATNGYDSSIHEMHFAHAVPATRRGYHCLTFDGPGQGRALFKHGLPIRPDWENVVSRVVDFALARPEVDPKRVALIGWSFGGYLAPRAASGEPRLAALIADPGQWDLLTALKAMLPLSPQARERLPDIAPADLAALEAQIAANPAMKWSFGRNLWVHGVPSVADLLRVAPQYTLIGRAEQIRCPTLVCAADSDPIAHFAQNLYDGLRCPKKFVSFTAAEGAGGHCEGTARALFHQRTFDWLDEALKNVAA